MASYEMIGYNSDDGMQLGDADAKVAFYGAVPVVQRPYSSSVHGSAAAASSTDFGAAQSAVLREIQNTLISLGIWASA